MTQVNASIAPADGRHQVQSELLRLFSEQLSTEVLSDATDLFEAGILDSLKFVELVLHLEHRFGAKIDLEGLSLDDFRNIAGITALVMRSQQMR